MLVRLRELLKTNDSVSTLRSCYEKKRKFPMRIFVKAKPNAKYGAVIKLDETHFEVSVKEPPIRGRANVAILAVLGEYFGVAPSRIRMLSGHTSRNKVIEIIL